MKLFGNKKSAAPTKAKHADAPLTEEAQQETTESRLQPRTRAIILMLGAIVLFAGAVAMCFTLINQSAEVHAMPLEEPKAIEYMVNVQPPAIVEDMPENLEAPKSMYNSNRLNFLLIGIDDATNLTNLVVLASVDLHTRDVALLSIPRETYISGNYDNPSICNVYKEAEGGAHGIESVKEKVKEMIGFWPDYYFVLNSKSVNGLLELTGSIEFEVPQEPAYSNLEAGNQSINGAKAIKLLNYKNGYKKISTEPARVQRMFLQTLLTVLLQDGEHIDENARAIAAFANTDLSSNDLAFLGHLLYGTDMKSIYSRALSGEEIEAEEGNYYQVDPAEAVAMLNERFNPLDEELTVYDLSFRQLAGDSGVGEYDPYGFGGGQNHTSGGNNNNDDDDDDETEETNTETEETEATEITESPDDPVTTEAPVESENPDTPQPDNPDTPQPDNPDTP